MTLGLELTIVMFPLILLTFPFEITVLINYNQKDVLKKISLTNKRLLRHIFSPFISFSIIYPHLFDSSHNLRRLFPCYDSEREPNPSKKEEEKLITIAENAYRVKFI